ncbi:MAG: FG-GAP repeat domain-containing protein, partial [Planctomycetaceae bacterium]
MVAVSVLSLGPSLVSCGPSAKSPEQRSVAPRTSAFDLAPPQKPTVRSGVHDKRATRFMDVAADRGIDHVYINGEAGRSLMVETMGGGAGWLDADGDGRIDLFLNQGGDVPSTTRADRPADRLFLNRGQEGFVDATAGSRIDDRGYGQGVAVGDFDDDGFDDLYVTNVDGNALYLSLGDGTFEDVTDRAGVRDGRWSTSAAWADLDGDGDLDLYVCNYLRYDPLNPLACLNARGEPRICHPRDVDPWPDECFRNNGDGTFTAVAADMGLVGPGNKALGVAIADFTDDGLVDIYVANDTEANFLFVGDGGGRYRER